MNFDLTEEQQALSELSKQIFEGSSPVDRVEEIETTEDRFDRPWGETRKRQPSRSSYTRDGGLGFESLTSLSSSNNKGEQCPSPTLPHL